MKSRYAELAISGLLILGGSGATATESDPQDAVAPSLLLKALAIIETPVMMLVFGAPGRAFALSPDFNSATGSYVVEVPADVVDVTVAATAEDPEAGLKAGGTDAEGGPLREQTTINGATTSPSVNGEEPMKRHYGLLKRFQGLTAGDNRIHVTVTSPDGGEESATTIVVRRDAQ